jgi:hypothetical protein
VVVLEALAVLVGALVLMFAAWIGLNLVIMVVTAVFYAPVKWVVNWVKSMLGISDHPQVWEISDPDPNEPDWLSPSHDVWEQRRNVDNPPEPPSFRERSHKPPAPTAS